jgi:predicted amidophosphoribosyltransferase
VAPVSRIVAAWEYAGAARALVLRLKLAAERRAGGPLAAGMARAAGRSGLTGQVITWVPGRPRDIRRRGFDHAEVLARAAGTRLGLPCRALLVRRGDRPDQTSLAAAERRLSPAGGFEGRPWASPVVLADDLITTGATASACAAALLAAGVPAVEVLVPCRA